MSRALVIHASFEDPGGAESYCARVISILQKRFDDVVIVHAAPPLDFEKLSKWSGIHLDPTRLRSEPVPLPRFFQPMTRLRSLFSLLLLRYAVVIRRARKLARSADFVVSTFAECPIKAPHLVQTIHFPMLEVDHETLSYLGLHYHGLRYFAHVGYVFAMRALMGWNRALIGNQLTVTNSKWTAAQFRRHYLPRDVRPMYFGVQTALNRQSPKWVPFSDRENNFVVLGRVVPAKQVEDAIDIIARLRAMGHDVGLLIVGNGSEPYASEIRRRLSSRPWAIWYTGLSRDDLESLVAKQKWGLHCFKYEHYGFAPAELQRLGCITFVPDSGGQREVIRNCAQRYSSKEDAVSKIDAVLRAPHTHEPLIREAEASATEHTVEAFEEAFQGLIDEAMREAP